MNSKLKATENHQEVIKEGVTHLHLVDSDSLKQNIYDSFWALAICLFERDLYILSKPFIKMLTAQPGERCPFIW